MVTQPENDDLISGCFWIQIASKASSWGSLSFPPVAFATLHSFIFSTIIKWPVSVCIHAQWRLVLSLLSWETLWASAKKWKTILNGWNKFKPCSRELESSQLCPLPSCSSLLYIFVVVSISLHCCWTCISCVLHLVAGHASSFALCLSSGLKCE